jgi:poly(beta-D-mannuronate) lyase
VVLRHGDNNTVENNIFRGNDKEGSGGVRVINKGQWVVHNLFYKCRGTWFKSPLAIMNGVPNSPANRYVAVTDAYIANNLFYESSAIGLGIGSDTERSVAPKDVLFHNNVFYNRRDSVVYNRYDAVDGIDFTNNWLSKEVTQTTAKGFHKISLPVTDGADPSKLETHYNFKPDQKENILQESRIRLSKQLTMQPLFADLGAFSATEKNTIRSSGANWFKNPLRKPGKAKKLNASDAASVQSHLASKHERIIINLTGESYDFKEALMIGKDVTFISPQTTVIKFKSPSPYFMHVNAGGALTIKNLKVDLAGVKNFLTTDTSGNSDHHNISLINAQFNGLKGTFLNASKAGLADSIIVSHCSFNNYTGDLFEFDNETTKKGLYNVEILKITHSTFQMGNGTILDMVRGGNDESTMGPHLLFSDNKILQCNSAEKEPLIQLYGTQLSEIENNVFTNSNAGRTILSYEDAVKAVHYLKGNVVERSGRIERNKFVEER